MPEPVAVAAELPIHASVEDRIEFGKAARSRLPRSAIGQWQPAAGRAAATELILGQESSRIQGLLPLRHFRMADSAFAFYRGSAIVMANDLGPSLNSGLWTQVCGDAHLANFGVFGTSERNLAFDLNDFDEVTRGPFEWDVLRLAASFILATEANGGDQKLAGQAAQAVGLAYQSAIAKAADQGLLANWYEKFTQDQVVTFAEQALGENKAQKSKRTVDKSMKAARKRDAWSAVRKLTEVGPDGRRQFRNQPPLLVRAHTMNPQLLEPLFETFRTTMRVEAAALLSRYQILDVAHKVVGVGSVGLRAWVLLLQGPREDDLQVMQFKQAQQSVYEQFVGAAGFDCHGQRVVQGQRLMQATGDPFLGWVTGPQAHLYGRQLRDFKWSVDTASLSFAQLTRYAMLCGATLAKAHARSGDPIAISAYIGTGPKFADSVAQFAQSYATTAAADYARFVDEVDIHEIDPETFTEQAERRLLEVAAAVAS